MAISGAHLRLNQFEESLEFADQGLRKSPSNSFFQMCRITCLVRLGRLAEAQAAADRFQAQYPDFKISEYHDLTRNFCAWTSIPPILEDALRTVSIPE
jgi:predicted Zn-dependent protease